MGYSQVRSRYAPATFAVVGCVAIALVLLLRIGSDSVRTVLADGAVAVVGIAAGLICFRRRRTTEEPDVRSVWLCFGAGIGSFGGSQGAQLISEVTGYAFFQALTWLWLVAACSLVTVGLAKVMRQVSAQEPWEWIRTLLDAAVVSWSVLLMLWVTLLGPALVTRQVDTLGAVITLGCVAGIVLTVTLMLYLVAGLSNAGSLMVMSWWGLLVALLFASVKDLYLIYAQWSGGYRAGSPVDAFWVLAAMFLLIAVVVPCRAATGERRLRPLGVALPYTFAIVAAVASSLMPKVLGYGNDATGWLRTALILLLIVHQIMSRRENRVLTRRLQARVVAGNQALETRSKRFEALVENSSDVIGLMDQDGVLRYVSDSVERVLGAPADQIVGLHVDAFLDEESSKIISNAVARVSATPMSRETVELRVTLPGDVELIMEEVVTNMLDVPGVEGYVLNARDITERRKLEDDLVHQAFHDALTGLANRALFRDRVEHALRRRSGLIGVLFLDLNGFKAVNDTLGHAVGDALLVVVADRLSACLRPGDTIARLGGDEFAVLVEDAQSEDEVVALGHRLHQALEPAITLDGQELFVGTAIGVAGAEVGTIDVEQLIRNADLAMYQAKERRDGQPALYDPSLHEDLLERMALEGDLRRALIDQELDVHYQPTYALESGELVGVEALARWSHPERGMIRPDLFIPLAEQTGMIHELGHLVLRRACAQGQEWAQLSDSTVLTVAVNVSGKQLQRRDFVDEVREVLRESGFPGDRLVLEMTESVLMNDTEQILDTLRALKDMGVRIAIDDFGTGYSSLSHLHHFPVDILKIDRSFVERLSGPHGADGESIPDSLVENIVRLGQTLNLETIAEGIEDPEQGRALRRLGCQQAQGYHFGRPGPAEAVTRLVAAAVLREENAVVEEAVA